VPLLEAYAGSVCADAASCMLTWSSMLASAMYWPQPRRVHLIHRSLDSDRVSKVEVDRPPRWKSSDEGFLMANGESSVCCSSMCSWIA
jgi:hypothetical protein